MKSKDFVGAAEGTLEGALAGNRGGAVDVLAKDRFAAWTLTAAFLFVLCADTLLGVVARASI